MRTRESFVWSASSAMVGRREKTELPIARAVAIIIILQADFSSEDRFVTQNINENRFNTFKMALKEVIL